MTQKTTISYIMFLFVAMAIVGVNNVQASEVIGTLSSDTSNNTPTSGSISGTVSSNSSGGSSSGGSRRSGGSSSSNTPAGAVLGASTDNTQTTPGFPNAGFASDEVDDESTLWSTVVLFFKGIFSF